jgi:hypothetical protein
MSYNKIILSEINRMREIMKLNLIVEGGGIGGVLDNFWDNLLSKNADELTAEERKLVDDLITSTPGLNKFKSAADALVDDATRKAFLDAISSNADEVSKVIQRVSQTFAKSSADNLTAKLANETSAELTRIKNEIAKFSGPDGLKGLRDYELDALKNELTTLKSLDGVSDDIKNATDDLIGSIDDTVKASKLTADDIASNVMTYNSIDDVINNIGKIIDDVDLQNSIKNKLSTLTEEQKASVNDFMSKITKEEQDEIFETFKGKMCTLKESLFINKQLINENWSNFCYGLGQFGPKQVKGLVSIIVAICVLIGVLANFKSILQWFTSPAETVKNKMGLDTDSDDDNEGRVKL